MSERVTLLFQMSVSYAAAVFSTSVPFVVTSGLYFLMLAIIFFVVSAPLFVLAVAIYLPFYRYIDRHVLSFSLLAITLAGLFGLNLEKRNIGRVASSGGASLGDYISVLGMAALAVVIATIACSVLVFIRFGGIRQLMEDRKNNRFPGEVELDSHNEEVSAPSARSDGLP